MPYLLDTHTFLWMAGDLSSLSAKVLEIVEERNHRLLLSAASAWEIAMLQQLKRVELPDVPQRFIPEAMQKLNVLPIPIGFTTAISAATLPFIHHDPFDRLIIAEALKEKMTVLTRGDLLKLYGPKMSVSIFKNIEFRNNFKGFDSFGFLKFETRWDCRSYRIYGVRCHIA